MKRIQNPLSFLKFGVILAAAALGEVSAQGAALSYAKLDITYLNDAKTGNPLPVAMQFSQRDGTKLTGSKKITTFQDLGKYLNCTLNTPVNSFVFALDCLSQKGYTLATDIAIPGQLLTTKGLQNGVRRTLLFTYSK